MPVDSVLLGIAAVCVLYVIYVILCLMVLQGREPLIEAGIFLGRVRRVALFAASGGRIPTYVAEYPEAKVSGLGHALMYVNSSFATADAMRDQGLDGAWFTVTYLARAARDNRPPLAVSARMVWSEDGNHMWEFPFGHKKGSDGDATLKGLWAASGYQEMMTRTETKSSE